MTLSPGENVGPYRIVEQLGSGGMATVFKAYHPGLDRYVAIKVLHAAFKADPQFFERFQREARIVAKLEHPNIIPVHDFNEHHGEPYLVMRFVEGDTMKPAMHGQPLPPAEVLRLMRPVCQALSYAHRQGVLHRDIKPSNIMVAEDGHVYLTDFGLARIVQAGESTLSQDMMIGTPQYISPEQAQGLRDLDGRTDIYSLGVVLYEMFTGRVPFSADTPFATVHDHIYTPLPLPTSLNPNLDPAIERLLLKALAKDPADRFKTADELLQALETTLGEQAKPAPAPPPPAGKKNNLVWVWVAAAALVVLILASLLVIGLVRRASRNLAGPAAPVQVAAAEETKAPPATPGPSAADALPKPPQPGAPANAQASELSRQAVEAMQQQQWNEAIGLYEKAIAADPHYLPAYLGLAQAQRQQGDAAGSLQTLETAVRNNPDSAEAQTRLGEAYLVAKRADAALEAFNEAAQLAPESAGLYARQALALLELDRAGEAKTAIDAALALDPLSSEAHLANALYLARQGDRRLARQELELVIRNARAPQFVLDRAREALGRLR